MLLVYAQVLISFCRRYRLSFCINVISQEVILQVSAVKKSQINRHTETGTDLRLLNYIFVGMDSMKL